MNRRAFIQGSLLAGAAVLLPLGVVAADPKPLKIVEVYKEGRWSECSWDALKKDTIFRLRLPGGTVDVAGTPNEISISTDDAFQDKGNWGVLCDPFTEVDKTHGYWDRLQFQYLLVACVGVDLTYDDVKRRPLRLNMLDHTVTFLTNQGAEVAVPLGAVRVLHAV